MKRFFIQYTWLLLLLVFVSCTKESEDPCKSRTLMMYMFADDGGSISSSLKKNIEDVVDNWSDTYDGNVVIYLDPTSGNPQLIGVRSDGKGGFTREIIKEYEEMDSTDPETFVQVVNEMKTLYPAESYGLVWGSHADAWVSQHGFSYDVEGGRVRRSVLADGLSSVNWVHSRSFGVDGGNHMDVADMAEALDRAFPEGLDFLLWDACYMSSIEVLYALRDEVRYVVASCTETPIAGYPYGDILPYLWGKGEQLVDGLKRVCDLYHEHYAAMSSSFGTATLVNMAGMDAFYAVCGDVLSGRLDEVSTLRKDEVYRYPLIDYTNPIFYDLGDYLVRMSRSDEEISRVKEALDDIVLYKICVNPFYNRGEIPADKFSGVNVFVPSAAWNYGNYYQTLSWFRVYGE